MTTSPSQKGQATVELALVTPLIVLLLLAIVQVALVARDQILVVHAARASARAAAVEPSRETALAAARQAADLDASRLMVSLERRGDRVIAAVTYSAPTAVPLVGRLLPDRELSASASFLVEP